MTNLTNDEQIMMIENAYWVDMKEALDRLHNNEDFKKVILEGYFKDFAIDQVSMLATDYARKSQLRPEIMERLVAISNLQDHFITIQQLGHIPDVDDEDENESEV